MVPGPCRRHVLAASVPSIYQAGKLLWPAHKANSGHSSSPTSETGETVPGTKQEATTFPLRSDSAARALLGLVDQQIPGTKCLGRGMRVPEVLGFPLGPGAGTSHRRELGPAGLWGETLAAEKGGSGDDHDRSRKASRCGRVRCLISRADPAPQVWGFRKSRAWRAAKQLGRGSQVPQLRCGSCLPARLPVRGKEGESWFSPVGPGVTGTWGCPSPGQCYALQPLPGPGNATLHPVPGDLENCASKPGHRSCD